MSLEVSVIDVVTRMSFEERDDFIRRHKYCKKNTSDKNPYVMGNRKTISRTYTGYNLDDLYEYCVFRNFINILNRFLKLPKKSSFTLGHHIPLAQGGLHAPSNWFIQTYRDNSRQGDSIPDDLEKMDWKEQCQYLRSNVTNDNIFDADLKMDYFKYVMRLAEVY